MLTSLTKTRGPTLLGRQGQHLSPNIDMFADVPGFEFPSDVSSFDQDGDGNISRTEAAHYSKQKCSLSLVQRVSYEACEHAVRLASLPQVSLAVRAALRERPKLLE